VADDQVVRITGLREVRAALKAVEATAPKDLSKGFKEIAAMVARRIAGKVPARTGRAASSIKPRGTTGGGAIAFGGPRAPHYPWLDFGGSTKVPGAGRRVQRDVVKGGRYVYPTIADSSDEIADKADDLIKRVTAKYGLATKEGGA
jgi:hypothetical protein